MENDENRGGVVKKFLAGAAAIAAATSLAAAAPATAKSDTGKITVFSTEVAELAVWDAPEGCVKLPVDAHVLVNQSDENVMIHGDPLCLTPGLTVAPGYGSHVAPGSGSFSVVR
jgi:hypothetical protein